MSFAYNDATKLDIISSAAEEVGSLPTIPIPFKLYKKIGGDNVGYFIFDGIQWFRLGDTGTGSSGGGSGIDVPAPGAGTSGFVFTSNGSTISPSWQPVLRENLPATITAQWTFTQQLTGTEPTQLNHFATKNYVDQLSMGVSVKPAVRVATTSNLPSTYNNGSAGVGATLTGVGALPTIDGVNLSVGNGILVKNQTNTAQNGRYVVTAISPNWIFTRCGLCDEASEIPGALIFVIEGTTQSNTSWIQTISVPLPDFDVGIDPIIVTQFGNAASGGVTSVAGKTGDVVLAATDVVSGIFDNARISEASVKQHESSLQINTSQLTGNLPISRFDSGTNANSSAFWAGDGTWKTVETGRLPFQAFGG